MSKRELILLGTSSQVPTRTRNHNAMFLLWDDLGILFDPGEGTQRQMLYAGLSASRITHIAITHFHGDHCLGLAGMIQRLSLDRATHAVEVSYPASGQEYFERLRHASIFHDAATIVPNPLQISKGEIEVARMGQIRLTARALDHSVPCVGYRIQEDDGWTFVPDLLQQHGVRGPAIKELGKSGTIEVNGKSVNLSDVAKPKRGQSFAIVMDTRPCAGASALAQGVDLLVCESTYLNSESQEANEHFHMTAEQAGKLAKDSRSRRLVLTHFSPRYQSSEPFVLEASAHFPDVFVAEDLLRVDVPPRVDA